MTAPISAQVNVLQLLEDHIDSEIKLLELEADKLTNKLVDLELKLTRLRTIQRIQQIKNEQQQVHIEQESQTDRS